MNRDNMNCNACWVATGLCASTALQLLAEHAWLGMIVNMLLAGLMIFAAMSMRRWQREHRGMRLRKRWTRLGHGAYITTFPALAYWQKVQAGEMTVREYARIPLRKLRPVTRPVELSQDQEGLPQ